MERGRELTERERHANEPVGVTTVFTPPPPRADMLYDVVDDPASHEASELRAAYERALVDARERIGYLPANPAFDEEAYEVRPILKAQLTVERLSEVQAQLQDEAFDATDD